MLLDRFIHGEMYDPGAKTVNHPKTEYAKSGEIHIAYQVIGDGPLDLILVPGWVSNFELSWRNLEYSRFLQRLAAFSRLILFDKRGTGLSDRVSESELPGLEQRMDDVRAVMDAVDSDSAALMGVSEGGTMSVLFAATYPKRTIALITFGIFAKRIWSHDYPWAPTPEQRQRWFDLVEQDWGGIVDLEEMAPSVSDDQQFREWWSAYLRQSASPAAALALGKMNTQIDIRGVLSSIQAPTLVLHRIGDRTVQIEEARYISSQIPGAKLVELPGSDHLPWVGDSRALLDEVEAFLTGTRPLYQGDRVLATILFTDIVSSTKHASDLGDQEWHTLLERHNALVRTELSHFAGREIRTTGDGFLVTFDGPARAIRCACAIRDAVKRLGIEIRAGLHTGEIEFLDERVAGIGVHIASRVMDEAGPSEVLVSRTVKDLIAGSGIDLKEKGVYSLKGIPEEWCLFTVAN
jgi:class 3 adenylate cyclase/surfactin synthase thioesterase subunit